MKRAFTSTLLVVVLLVVCSITSYSVPELYKVSVSGTPPIPKAPAFINYTLNCVADMTFEIYPSDGQGNIWGPPVRTDWRMNTARGSHTYLWACTFDDGSPAYAGYYLCRLTAAANPTSFSPLFTSKADDPGLLYDSWVPPVADIWGYYGASINTNPLSAYYGRIYAANVNDQDVHMWDCDGTYLGTLDDSGITWGSSAPWDTYVARDGYVYVADRTNTKVYCFPPDGSRWVSSGNASYARGMFVRQTPDDVTHIYMSSGAVIYHFTVSPDHLTWTPPEQVADPPDGVWGLWVTADRSAMYVCQAGGTVAKWNKGSGESFTQDTGWTCPVTGAYDVCGSPDGDYLFIGRLLSTSSIAKYWVNAGNTTTAPWAASTAYTRGQAVQPLVPNGRRYICITAGTSGWEEPLWPTAATETVADGTVMWQEGSPTYYTGAPYVKGVQCDAVGNILITYGRSGGGWPSYYWCLATEAGTYSVTKQTGPFEVQADPAPVVVPGSATWSYSDPSGKLRPDDSATATVNFKVLDANGFSDIASVKVDPTSLRLASDAGVLVNVDSLVADTSDANGLTVLCSKTFRAVVGAKAGLHTDIRIESRDVHYPMVAPTYENYSVNVLGATFTGTVKHIRHQALIAGATISVIGGMSGVYGYPFTYTTGLTDSNGQASVSISEGSFTAIASKIGYKTHTPISLAVVPPDIGGSIAMVFYLGPFTIAEAKALPSGTTACVEGVCYAQPKGLAPTAAYGLDRRLNSPSGTIDPTYNQWYMCDPGNAGSGSMFMLRPISDPEFPFTWDDPLKVDDYGKSVYIGPRPSEGQTICATVDCTAVPSGQERRFTVKDSEFLAELEDGSYYKTYLNRGNLGDLPSAPVNLTIPQMDTGWGKYGKVHGYVIGRSTNHPEGPVSWVITDSSGSFGSITADTRTSLGMTSFAPQIGGWYDFTGAVGRRPDEGSTIRIRKPADAYLVTPPTTPEALGSIRDDGTGYPVDVSGVVTMKGSNYLYMEAEDCSVGVRVAAAPSYVLVGDKIHVVGSLGLEDGEKFITPTQLIAIIGSGAIPALVFRTMDVGGADYGPDDPGITYGRGPLNVGLLVRLFGLVTARDPGGQWFYLWDGANRGEFPLDDGTGNLGVRVISTFAVVPDTDFVKATGVVSTNTTTVPGRVIPEILPTETPVRLYP